MTMGDEALFADMTLPGVMIPALDKLEMKHLSDAHSLRSAFLKVEAEHPGFCYDFMNGLLRRANLQGKIKMTECMLRLEATSDSQELRIHRTEEPFLALNQKAAILKKILSRIPDEIYDRKKFLETIKEIASAIRHLLDSVNGVTTYLDGHANHQTLDRRKREFVRCSKSFSNTLKEFFKDNRSEDVFLSGCHLVNQTNLILKTVKEIC